MTGSIWATAPTVAAFVATIPPLSAHGRRRIVEQALHMLHGYYVHLPFKRELHDADPLTALKGLLPQVGSYRDDVAFHAAMCDIFNRLRDLHTAYHLPGRYAGHVAVLPFEVGCCGAIGERRYLITRVVDDARRRHGLIPGAELLMWDGAPIQRAVARDAQLSAGANRHAKHARAVEALTMRPLLRNPPPGSDQVAVTFRTPRGRVVTAEVEWRVCRLGDESPHHRTTHHSSHVHLALDHEGDAFRRARQTLYGEASVVPDAIPTRMPSVFSARILANRRRRFGYLQIVTFKVRSDERFVDELRRLLTKLPQDGLVLDVRGNSGGLVLAAERSLQLLTSRRIEPQSFQFLASPQTLAMCRRRDAPSHLAAFRHRIAAAMAKGHTWCEGLPISDMAACNDSGQVYPGPVVLLTDARCYSAADIFVAGFADHAIGHIIGTAASTGAGGATVWPHRTLRALTGSDGRFAALPQRGELRVAVQRCLRVGARAGEVLEERGVAPDEEHCLTRDDLLHDGRDLLMLAMSRLSGPRHRPAATPPAQPARAV